MTFIKLVTINYRFGIEIYQNVNNIQKVKLAKLRHELHNNKQRFL